MFDSTHRHRNTRNSSHENEFHSVRKPDYKRPNNKWLKLSIVFVLLFAISSIAYIVYFVEFTPDGMQLSHITPPEAPYHGIYEERVQQYKTKQMKTLMALRYLVEDIEITLRRNGQTYAAYKTQIGYDPFDRVEFDLFRREVNAATSHLHMTFN